MPNSTDMDPHALNSYGKNGMYIYICYHADLKKYKKVLKYFVLTLKVNNA